MDNSFYARLYHDNPDFKRYVDRYTIKNGSGKLISVEQALTHALVHNVGDVYAVQMV